MWKITVLIEGYARETENEVFASSSVSLIKTSGLNILVDTGMDKQLLLDRLKEQDLTPSDIDFVVLTHTHLDHCLLAGICENAKILDRGEIYSFDGKISNHDGKIPGTDIEIISCPGHDQFHCAVALDTKEYGKVVVAADLFWWLDNAEQLIDIQSLIHLEDPYMKDREILKESRKNILNIADYIIPGHGKPFIVPQNQWA